jgi:O-antigen/teichoic acid export membrane protein
MFPIARQARAGPITVSSEARADLRVPSGASLLARVSRGVGALSLNAGVNVIGQLSIVPVALYAWGEVRYGEWIVLTGLISLLKLTDLGLQTFVVNRLCASYARDDREEMHHILHSTLRIQYLLVGGVLGLISIALLVVPLNHALQLRTVAGLNLYVVALLLAIELLIGVPMGVIGGIYRATGRLARAAMIGACQQLALVGLTLALIASQTTFVSLAGARVGIALIISVWLIYDLRRLYPWLRIWPTSGTWRDGLRMIGPGLFFLLIPVADYLSGQFTLMVIQKTLEGGAVSRLATHRTVVNLAQMASGLLMHAVWPELTALHARAQNGDLTWVYRSLAKLNLWLVGAVAFGVLPFIPWIYPSWTAGRLTLDEWTLAFLTIRMLIWGIWSASMTMLAAINRHQLVALTLLGASGITSILAVTLVPVMGISGAALAALLGDLCVSAWLVPSLACREIGDSFSAFLAEAGAALSMGIGIPVGLGLVAWLLLPSPLLRYLLVIPISMGIALMLMWRQLAPFERQFVVHVYRRGRGALSGRRSQYAL